MHSFQILWKVHCILHEFVFQWNMGVRGSCTLLQHAAHILCYCSYELNHAFAVNLAWKVILKIYYDLFVPNISSAGTHQQAALQGVYKPLVVLNLIERVKPRAENR